jgi:hypothetical protein
MRGHRGVALAFEDQRRASRVQEKQVREQASRLQVRDAGIDVAEYSQAQIDQIASRLSAGEPAAKAVAFLSEAA